MVTKLYHNSSRIWS